MAIVLLLLIVLLFVLWLAESPSHHASLRKGGVNPLPPLGVRRPPPPPPRAE